MEISSANHSRIRDIHHRFMKLAGIEIGSDQHTQFLILEFLGEAGELANEMKKILRDGLTTERIRSFDEELADTVITLMNLVREYGLVLDPVIKTKLDKVETERLIPREKANVVG